MKFDHLVDVSFHNFVFNGKFDFVELGQTMAWLEQNFVEPDSKNDMGNGFYIWLFGNVEFHFENNKLYMIWCDYLSQIHLGKAIRFDKGILNNVAELNVTRVFNMLVNEGADLQIRRQSPHTLLQGFHAGWRKSGIGGADGKHGLHEYLQTQVVYLQS